jgi:solute carrier family 35, member E1
MIFVLETIFKKYLFNLNKNTDNAAILITRFINPVKLNKLNILFYSSLVAFTFMAPFTLFLSDEISILTYTITDSQTYADAEPLMARILTLFTLNGLSHTTQALSAFMLLGAISPLSFSIAGLMKRIVVIVVSIAVFNDLEKVDGVFGLGLVLCFGGLWLYERAIAASGSEIVTSEQNAGQGQR